MKRVYIIEIELSEWDSSEEWRGEAKREAQVVESTLQGLCSHILEDECLANYPLASGDGKRVIGKARVAKRSK